MSVIAALVARNIKLFFKDKGMFFTSLVTPAILLVLYAAFLGNVYHDTFTENLPAGVTLSEETVDGLVGAQLVSSILSVSCVTVAFCSNFLMVQDRANGTARDFAVSPARPAALAVGYYVAAFISTLIICLAATALCLAYLAAVGGVMPARDLALLLADVLLLALFGTALSSVVNFFLSTQGQISAVGTIVSAGYGFICGAYMPISSFGEGLQRAVSLLPGTYGTALVRNHSLGGVFEKMRSEGAPAAVVDSLKTGLDCNLSFFGSEVSIPAMYAVLCGSVALLVAAYVVLNIIRGRK